MDNPEPPVSLEEFRSRLSSLCGNRGVSSLPRRLRSRLIVLKAASLCYEPGKKYSQWEVDSMLRTWLGSAGQWKVDHMLGTWFGLVERWMDADPVHLRRLLIDEGLLSRTPDGSQYWRSIGGGARIQFAPEIDELGTELLQKLRQDAEVRRRKEEVPSTTLHFRLTQVLRAPENVLIEWDGRLVAAGTPEDRAEQLRRVGSWYFVVAPFLALLPEVVGRATNSAVHYEIEWADDTIFMTPEARGGAAVTDAIYGWECLKVPVFVLVSSPEPHDKDTHLAKAGVEAVAFLVPRFRMEGAGRHVKVPPIWSLRSVDCPAFGFEVASDEVAEAIHAAANACQVGIEHLGPLLGNWRPQAFSPPPQR